MNKKRLSWEMVILLVAMVTPCGFAASRVGLHSYAAAIDGVSGDVVRVGQKVVHLGFELRLRETVANPPILSLQYTGQHYRESPPNDSSHVEARAKSVAERIVHAWTLMDHGARLEVADDNWNVFRTRTKRAASYHTAIYVRSPVAGAEPLRILTVYPQDVAGYPWISSEKMLADYLANLIEAHYLLFWRNEGDLSKYRAMHLGKTREGKIFTEVAARASDAAEKKGLTRFDSATLRDVLAALPLSQRERLYRLATTPPVDWESASNK